MKVTLTGTMGGPDSVNGLAGSGTLVSYGTESNGCRDQLFQFDIGRGTTLRLSELDLKPNDISALFLTHIHSDHVDDLSVFLQHKWTFLGQAVDLVCSDDIKLDTRVLSCKRLVAHIADAYIESGEIAQRLAENPGRNIKGPSALANVLVFNATDDPKIVWQSADGGIVVSAIRTQHIGGSAAYRVDTPAGSVVIGGDASNDNTNASERPYSTSDNVERLAYNADILVHSVIHPIMAAPGTTFPARIFNRFSTAPDIGAMAERVGVDKVMLTHLIPPLGETSFNNFDVPGGEGLDKQDYMESVGEGGFSGEIYVGVDLLSVKSDG